MSFVCLELYEFFKKSILVVLSKTINISRIFIIIIIFFFYLFIYFFFNFFFFFFFGGGKEGDARKHFTIQVYVHSSL